MSANNGLTVAYSYILFSLAEPLHGYGIMQKVQEMSEGTFTVGPGTLYAALTNMQERGWIEPHGKESDRRKNYRLTRAGKEIITEEFKRIRLLWSAGGKAIKLLQLEPKK